LKKKYIILSVTVGVVLLLDQISKIYVASVMTLNESAVVISGFFNITHVRNPGAAFGFLADSSPVFRSAFFIIIALVAIVLILVLVVKIKDRELLLIFSLSLILSGAVGNFLDRIRLGEVVDFLDFYILSYHWPAFNMADSAITVGAMVLIYEIVGKKTT